MEDKKESTIIEIIKEDKVLYNNKLHKTNSVPISYNVCGELYQDAIINIINIVEQIKQSQKYIKPFDFYIDTTDDVISLEFSSFKSEYELKIDAKKDKSIVEQKYNLYLKLKQELNL